MGHCPEASLPVAGAHIDELKQHLLHVWHGIDQLIIDNAIDEWHGHLCACMRVNG